MKRLLLIIGFVLFCLIANGQNFVYQPFIPERNSSTYQYDFYIPANTYSTSNYSKSTVKKVSEEIVNIVAYNVMDDNLCNTQVKEVIFSDGTVEHTLIGIKINNYWKSVNYEIVYILDLLSHSNLDKATKELLLHCSEYATHITVLDDIILLIGLKE